MQAIDGLVVLLYIAGTLAVGLIAGRRTRNSEDMFSAGGNSPWWMAGLSSFMTLKSAGTFVVWGGLAYREGVVSIAMNTMIGFSGLLVGRFLAGRWRRLGVRTPAEFVTLRFGPGAVQFYTWSMLVIRIFSSGVALYAVSVMFAALVPLPPGMPFRDPVTGNLTVAATVAAFGAIILFYTIVGGLWAVLMTDVLQFVVLQLSVLFVLPLLLLKLYAGGPIAPLPHGFFLPISDRYGILFMLGWAALHFFFVGAEWAFAQRYICVPTDRDAQKGAYLFGALYLVSPTIWLATPLIYRMINPAADPEQAYILASQAVLPVGMLGLMMAAMFSATASSVSAQINVFAGVLTDQLYRRVIAPSASERHLMRVGRILTLIIGLVLTAVALLVPYAGGAEKIVLTITALLLGPLMAPTVWGLLSGRIGLGALLAAALISFASGLIIKFPMTDGGALANWAFAQWIQANPRLADVIVGGVVPNVILAIAHLASRGNAPGWSETVRRISTYTPARDDGADHGSGGIVSASLAGSGLLMLLLLFVDADRRVPLGIFGVLLLVLAGIAHHAERRSADFRQQRR